MPNGIRVIGLTGGIATGKSSVASFFRVKGVPVVDADQLARDAVKPGTPALAEICKIFGSKVITSDGTLDRKLLGEIIFSDNYRRKQLESILHPAIQKLSEKAIADATAKGHKRLIYMAPLLIEAGAIDRVDTIWVVSVSPEIQLMRLMKRENISRNQAELIVATQMPLDQKARFGSVIIDNSGNEAETNAFLETVWADEMGRLNE